MKPTKRTKIVCTIGPASHTPETLEKMIQAGMNVARLNFSHGTHEDHAKLIVMLRELAIKTGEPLAILGDLQGPKIRVGDLPKEGITLVNGETIIFTTDPAAKLPKIPLTYDKLHQDVKAGESILLDDGLLEVKVLSVKGRDISCEVVNGGPLTSHKGFNLPKTTLSVPAITEKDKADVIFAVKQHVDWVALSFVRSSKDIHALRDLIVAAEKDLGKEHLEEQPMRIIAKIEKHEAIRNIDEIVEAVDAVMVARGDLGIETPAAEVPMAQKMIIEKCLKAAKPVIVATQMLDSMIRNPRPTRAEVSDVANAVIDHADAVMLSGETASGKYPVEAVETMARVAMETEASKYDNVEPHRKAHGDQTTAEAISEVAGVLARDVGAKMILVGTSSGNTARIVSRERPELPIYAATDNARALHQLNLSWGVRPFLQAGNKDVDDLIARAVSRLKKEKRVAKGDKIIVVAGTPVGKSGSINMIEVKQVE